MLNIDINRKLNKSMVFLTPMIANGRRFEFFYGNVINFKNSPFFINCYYKDINKPWLNEHIFLVYKLVLSKDFILLEQQLRRMPHWVTDYSYIQNGCDYVIHVFKIPDEYKNDYLLFKQGLYSQLNNNYKIDILRFWKVSFDSKLCSYLLKTKLTEKEREINTDKIYINDEHLPKIDDSEIISEMEFIRNKD